MEVQVLSRPRGYFVGGAGRGKWYAGCRTSRTPFVAVYERPGRATVDISVDLFPAGRAFTREAWDVLWKRWRVTGGTGWIALERDRLEVVRLRAGELGGIMDTIMWLIEAHTTLAGGTPREVA